MQDLAFRVLGPSDRPLYEDALRRFPAADFAQSWAWGELKGETGWRPLRVAVTDGADVRLVATLLLRRLPLPLLPWSLLYCPRGPVSDADDTAALRTFLSGAGEIGRQRRAIFLKLEPAIEEGEAASRLRKALGLRKGRRRGSFEGFMPRHVAVLCLDGGTEAVFGRMTAKGRYNTRLAMRRGVEVTEGSLAHLPAFYRLLRATAARQRFHPREYGYVRRVVETVIADGGRLFLAHREGRLLAGALVARCGQRASYLIGASADEGRRHMAAYLVQWSAIRWAVGDGARIYDFLGIGNPRRPGRLAGLWDFKRRFGASPVSYVGEWDLPLAPLPYALWVAFEPALSLARAYWARVGRRRARAADPLPEGAG